tara:strand:+ start:1317 stop:2078 length:762 start_codon:yes stop_codon:yes gene_type:complete
MIEKFLKNRFLFNTNSNLLKKIYMKIHLKLKNQKFQKTYSKNTVDLLINYLFRNNDKGIYIDVGCAHPIEDNNTYILHKKGWSGINIDLDSYNIDLFNSLRPMDYNKNIAISDKAGDVDLYFYHHKSKINTIEKNVHQSRSEKIEKVIKIKADTLNNIIENSPFKGKKINYLTIDVEGHEMKVLQGFDIIKYNPDIVVVEFLDLKLKKLEFHEQNINTILNSNLYKFMLSKKYHFVNWMHSDLIFVSDSIRTK